MLAVAIAIRLQGAGPILYRMTTFAPDGTKIETYKFRIVTIEEKGYDPRVTKLGAFLQRTGLAMLPRLFNILKGEMSIVGPIPRNFHEYRRYESLANEKVKIEPGIIPLEKASCHIRITPTDDMIRLLHAEEMEYVNNWSLWGDMKIIWNTIVRRSIPFPW